jgi:Asp-tRNA(Asn)/Glu-tRNA(Gln) amidotransferase B subunit
MNTSIRTNLTEKLGKKIDRKNINLCDKIICQHKYELDLNQQDYLNDNKNCKESNILSLAQEVYKNSKLIEQTEEFKNVRKFLQKLWRGGEYDNYTDEQLDFLF